MRLRIALACVFLLNFLPAQTANGDAPIGHVIGFEGAWLDQACKCKVDVGHAIWSGSKIVRQGPTKPVSRLTIRLAATGRPEPFDCSTIDCAYPLDILARVPKNEKRNQIGTFLSAALSVVAENLRTTGGHSRTVSGYARAFSRRGPTAIPITDAIVPLRDGRPDLSAVFASVEAGTYLIEFCSVSKTGVSACPDTPDSEEFFWKADGNEALSSRSIQPTLYELFLCRRQGDRVFRRESAFVLVALRELAAGQMREKHKEFLNLMDGWTPKEVSMLQHAYLQHLNLTENR
jgi:hypothetical protein